MYENYRWLPELTIPLASALCEQLPIPVGAKVLDFGCALGYLVKALRLLHRDAWGIDVSDYALSQAPEDVKPYVRHADTTLPRDFDWVLAKDVLEHVRESEIDAVLGMLRHAGRRLWAAIPLGDGEKYVIPAYEEDVTHRIRRPIGWWCDRFIEADFYIESAVYRMPHIKEAWSDWPEGNGFFVCR